MSAAGPRAYNRRRVMAALAVGLGVVAFGRRRNGRGRVGDCARHFERRVRCISQWFASLGGRVGEATSRWRERVSLYLYHSECARPASRNFAN
jgi:hypothetical protein